VLKLSRYLKPFLPAIIMVMLLLFAQTISELYLPNLMSYIINVGIQQGGIEEVSPKAVSQDGMQLIQTFMTEDERTLVNANYTLVDGSDVDAKGKTYESTWPAAAGTKIYVQNSNVSAEDKPLIDRAFNIANAEMIHVFQNVKLSAGASGSTLEANGVIHIVEGDNSVAEILGANTSGVALIDQRTGLTTSNIENAYGLIHLYTHLPDDVFAGARAVALGKNPQELRQSGIVLVSALYGDLKADLAGIEMSYIFRIGMIMLGIAVLTGAATIWLNYLTTRVGTGLGRDLRTAVFAKVASFSHTEFDRFSTASLITRSTNDIMMMQRLIGMGMRMIFHAPIMGIGAAIMAVSKAPSMSWVIVLGVVIILAGVITQMAIVTPKFRIVQTLTDKLNLVAREKLTGLMVIRAFNRDEAEIKRFDNANSELTKVHIFTGRVMALMGPYMTIVMNGMSILVIALAAQEVAKSTMQVGDMMAYMQYIMQVMMSFMQLSMMFNMIPRAQVSAGRIIEVLETVPAIQDPAQPKSIEADKRGMVEFQDVSFMYEGAEEYALEEISFKALPGQTIAFIGPTGSGKTSIFNLVPRLYDVAKGRVLVGDIDVREITQKELRANIGYVPQRNVLMGGTIASNIAYGVPEDDSLMYEDYIKIASVAQAIDFIGDKEAGFYEPVAQGGTNVSGGQRQRLAIARALGVRPAIYLFDDSFSALDFTTDAALRKALREHTADSTLLIVSQRIGTIMDADVIHVIDEGRIIGSGTHEELLETCPMYFEIASTQLAEVAQANAGGVTETEIQVSLSEGGAK